MNFLNSKWVSLFCAVLNFYFFWFAFATSSWFWCALSGVFTYVCFNNYLNQSK